MCLNVALKCPESNILPFHFSIMLMYGSAKNSRWLILPWLVATFLFILAYIAGMILSTYLFGVSLLSIAFLTIAIIEVNNYFSMDYQS